MAKKTKNRGKARRWGGAASRADWGVTGERDERGNYAHFIPGTAPTDRQGKLDTMAKIMDAARERTPQYVEPFHVVQDTLVTAHTGQPPLVPGAIRSLDAFGKDPDALRQALASREGDLDAFGKDWATLRQALHGQADALLEAEIRALETIAQDWEADYGSATAARNLAAKVPLSALARIDPLAPALEGGPIRLHMIRGVLEHAIVTDPLLRTRVGKDGAIHYDRPGIVTARDALVDRLVMLLPLVHDDAANTGQVFTILPATLQSMADTVGHEGAMAWGRECMTVSVILRAVEAPVFLWLDEMRRMAHAFDLPRHVVSSELIPTPTMWWCYEHDLVQDDGARAVGTLLVRHPDSLDAIHLAGYLAPEDGPRQDAQMSVSVQRIPYGATFPDDFPEGPERQGALSVLTMLAFMNSPYIEHRQARLDRQVRRQMERDTGREVRDTTRTTVRTVHLRAAAPDEPRAEPGGEERPAPTGRHVQVRFWVRGHYRAQWYPSLKAHQVIWIAPVLKGPADAPLKPPKRTVFRVDR